MSTVEGAQAPSKRARSTASLDISSSAGPTFLPIPHDSPATGIPRLSTSPFPSNLSTLAVRFARLRLQPSRKTVSILGKRKRDDSVYDSQMSAPEQVLGIYELVEQILSYLPAAEILRAQAVKRSFRSVYESSQDLQFKTLEQLPSEPLPRCQVNPLLVKSMTRGTNRKMRTLISTSSQPFAMVETTWNPYPPADRLMLKSDFTGDEVESNESWRKLYLYNYSCRFQLMINCGNVIYH